jgi:hypothetical protein
VRKLRYEQHKRQFKGRNSYSKTDPDATFMRMKEDHMLNGQLKPGYNMQVGTENGFAVNYSIHSNPTDTRTLNEHINHYAENYGHYPKNLITDKGYGSAENYQILEDRGIQAFIKYRHWDQEQKKRSKKYRYKWWRFTYDEDADCFTCPEGKLLTFERWKTRRNWVGAIERFKEYRCAECKTCPVLSQCTNREYRHLEFNYERFRLQQLAKLRLMTEQGRRMYKSRGSEVETVFGQIKGNWGFRRLQGWGKQNAQCEWGIFLIAYNLKNLANRIHL